jgi:protein-disulfide isomerase
MASRESAKQRRREARRTAQAQTADAARRRRRRRIASGAAGAVALVAVVALVVAVNRGGEGQAAARADDPVLGKRTAPVTIIEYGDFKCPNCAAFFASTEPRLRRQYVDSGMVRLIWRDFPNIDAESAPAAEATRCAGAQGRFWQYRDALYTYVIGNFWSRGINVEGAHAYAGHYQQLARHAGVSDLAAFRRCRASGTYHGAVAAALDAGAAAGVDGTPTFFINGQRLVGAQPYNVFRRLIDAQLAGS